MRSNFERRPRREPLELQLTAMIDIFSLIVIFLILGGVVGSADITLPDNFLLPKSFSKENPESAPQLIISGEEAIFVPLNLKISMDALRKTETDPALKKQITDYVQSLPIESRKAGLLLNVVADAKTPYEKVFLSCKFFRIAGFKTLLFVTTPGKAGVL